MVRLARTRAYSPGAKVPELKTYFRIDYRGKLDPPEIEGIAGEARSDFADFVDIERGWDFTHRDLAPHGITLLGGSNIDSSKPHGSGVLGVVCLRCDGYHFQNGSLGVHAVLTGNLPPAEPRSP